MVVVWKKQRIILCKIISIDGRCYVIYSNATSSCKVLQRILDVPKGSGLFTSSKIVNVLFRWSVLSQRTWQMHASI